MIEVKQLYLCDLELDAIKERLEGKDRWDDLQECLDALGIGIDPYRANELLGIDDFGMCDTCSRWTVLDVDFTCTDCWLSYDEYYPY